MVEWILIADNEWSPAAIAAAVIAIAAPITALLTWWAKYGVDAWLKQRRGRVDVLKAQRELELLDEKQIDDGLKFLIRDQDKRLRTLETHRIQLQDQYTRCIEEHSAARTLSVMQGTQIKSLEHRLAECQAVLDKHFGPSCNPPDSLTQ